MIMRICLFLLLIVSLAACAGGNPKHSLETPPVQPAGNVSAVETSAPSLTSTPERTETPTVSQPINTPLPTAAPDIQSLGKDLEIAFQKDDRLWVWRQGTLTDLGPIPYAKMLWMSGDGAYIAFNSERDLEQLGFFDFWVTDMAGNRKLLLDAATFKTMASPGLGLEWPDIQIDWIPGTHAILINDCQAGRLYSLDAETGKTKKFQQLSKPGYAHLSPDGKKLLFITFDELLVIDLKTHHLTKILKFARIPSVTGSPNFLSPVWLNDSTKFRIAIPLTDVGANEPKTEIIEVDLQNNVVTRLQEIPTPYTLLQLSPKGAWTIYGERTVAGSDNPIDLHLLNLQDGTDQWITSGDISILAWSPDEQRVMLLYQDQRLTRLLTVGSQPAVQDLEGNPHFETWLDPDRYFTSRGEIRSVTKEGSLPLIAPYQGNPFDFMLRLR
jgi:hypothetical protein